MEFGGSLPRKQREPTNPIERLVNDAKQMDEWWSQPLPEELKTPPEGV